MPDSIVNDTLKEIEPLSVDDPVGPAARKVIEAGLPGLPVVDEAGNDRGGAGDRLLETRLPGYGVPRRGVSVGIPSPGALAGCGSLRNASDPGRRH
jgi:CBS domain-containing protein